MTPLQDAIIRELQTLNPHLVHEVGPDGTIDSTLPFLGIPVMRLSFNTQRGEYFSVNGNGDYVSVDPNTARHMLHNQLAFLAMMLKPR